MKLHWRKIVIDGIEWKWRMGRASVVARTEGKTATARVTAIMGISQWDFEKAKWKHYLHVTPKDIANWLRNVK